MTVENGVFLVWHILLVIPVLGVRIFRMMVLTKGAFWILVFWRGIDVIYRFREIVDGLFRFRRVFRPVMFGFVQIGLVTNATRQ